jgi:hypothetical protein
MVHLTSSTFWLSSCIFHENIWLVWPPPYLYFNFGTHWANT